MKSYRFAEIWMFIRKTKILRKRPMCWLAIGFLLILLVFLLGRGYNNTWKWGIENDVLLEGEIVSKEYKENSYGGFWQLTLKHVRVQVKEERNRNTYSIPGKYLCRLATGERFSFKIGQHILLEGKYEEWEKPTNPGQFDSQEYYLSLGILGQFKKCKVVRLGEECSVFRENLWRIRQQAERFLTKRLGREDGALISAMLL